MNKANLQIGKKYLHIRKTVIDGVEREAERRKTIETYNRYMILNGKQIV